MISPGRLANKQANHDLSYDRQDSMGKYNTRRISKQQSYNPYADRNLQRQQTIPEDKYNIVRICITGGPCAGKTTAMADIKQDLTQLGVKVLMVPEAATILMKGGAFIVSTGFTESECLNFQRCLMRL